VTQTTTVEAIATLGGWTNSAVGSEKYAIQLQEFWSCARTGVYET
jgi:hypothetical protein